MVPLLMLHHQDPYSPTKTSAVDKEVDELHNDTMLWTICCNSLGDDKVKTTFQSFLNVLKLKEVTQDQVNTLKVCCWLLRNYFQDSQHLKFEANYQVVEEINLKEKLKFINGSNFYSGCSEVSKNH